MLNNTTLGDRNIKEKKGKMVISKRVDFVAIVVGEDRRGCDWKEIKSSNNTLFDLDGGYIGIHFIIIEVKNTHLITKCVFAKCKFHENKGLNKTISLLQCFVSSI